VGTAVSSFKPGDRVYVNPGVGCGECRYCRHGQAARCDDYTFMGYFGFGPGSQEIFRKYPYAGYSEYMTAPVTNLVRLPTRVSFAQATRFGYFGTAYSGLKKSALSAGQTILILGASGTLGVGATLFALALGASRVLVAARQLPALERLKALDPQRVQVVAVGSRPVSELVRELEPGGVDVMVDTLGAKAPAALSIDAMRAVARGGRIIQIGGVAGPIPIDPHPFMCAQLQYIGSLWFSSVEGDEMARLIDSGMVDLSLIEERPYRLDQLDRALDDIQTQGDGFTNFHIVHG
jgi:alcohol dehydrogenase